MENVPKRQLFFYFYCVSLQIASRFYSPFYIYLVFGIILLLKNLSPFVFSPPFFNLICFEKHFDFYWSKSFNISIFPVYFDLIMFFSLLNNFKVLISKLFVIYLSLHNNLLYFSFTRHICVFSNPLFFYVLPSSHVSTVSIVSLCEYNFPGIHCIYLTTSVCGQCWYSKWHSPVLLVFL